LLFDVAEVKKGDRLIEVIATDIADLAMMGFGSVKNCRSVYNALIKKYTHVNLNIIRTKSDLDEIIYRKPDLVFSGIKYVTFNRLEITKNRADKIWISEYMEEAGINYTGSEKDAIELEFSKDAAKKRVEEFGINTAPYFVAKPGMYKSANELPIVFPLFIKPLSEGDSKGIESDSIIYDFNNYQKKVKDIYTLFKQSALVEKFLSGREFTVSILGSDSNGEPIANPVEIILTDKNSDNNFLGYKIKKEKIQTLIAIEDEDIYKNINSIAKNSFIALGARDYGRIDIKMDDKGCPYFLEANLVPGMRQNPNDIKCSFFPRACFINTNITYQETVHKIAEIAFNRIENNITQERVGLYA
jgi:D-alanine-D-alanine ligase